MPSTHSRSPLPPGNETLNLAAVLTCSMSGRASGRLAIWTQTGSIQSSCCPPCWPSRHAMPPRNSIVAPALTWIVAGAFIGLVLTADLKLFGGWLRAHWPWAGMLLGGLIAGLVVALWILRAQTPLHNPRRHLHQGRIAAGRQAGNGPDAGRAQLPVAVLRRTVDPRVDAEPRCSGRHSPRGAEVAIRPLFSGPQRTLQRAASSAASHRHLRARLRDPNSKQALAAVSIALASIAVGLGENEFERNRVAAGPAVPRGPRDDARSYSLADVGSRSGPERAGP